MIRWVIAAAVVVLVPPLFVAWTMWRFLLDAEAFDWSEDGL